VRIRVKIRRLKKPSNNGRLYTREEDIVKSHFGVRLWDCRTKNKKKFGLKSTNLTPEYLYRLYLKQNKRCIYTGIKLFACTRRVREYNKLAYTWYQASIDRIDPNRPYEKGNVQLVCAIINRSKTDIPSLDFINLGTLLHKRRKKIFNIQRKIKYVK
jgi:hypothetical protein